MSCSKLAGNLLQSFLELSSHFLGVVARLRGLVQAHILGALSHLSVVASTEMAIVSLTWSFQSWVLSADFFASLTEWWFVFRCWDLLRPQTGSHLPRSPLGGSGALSAPWGTATKRCMGPLLLPPPVPVGNISSQSLVIWTPLPASLRYLILPSPPNLSLIS